MRELPNVVYGDQLLAKDFNDHKNNEVNLIIDSGQTPSQVDNTQFAKAISNYGREPDIYCIDSGSNGNFALASQKEHPQNYFAGMKIIFKLNSLPAYTSTIKIDNLAVKNVVRFNSRYDDWNNAYYTGKMVVAYYDVDDDIFILRDDMAAFRPTGAVNSMNLLGELALNNGVFQLKLPTPDTTDHPQANPANPDNSQDLIYAGQFCSGVVVSGTGSITTTFPEWRGTLEVYSLSGAKIKTLDLITLSSNTYNPSFTGVQTFTGGNKFWSITFVANRGNNTDSSKDFTAVLCYYMNM